MKKILPPIIGMVIGLALILMSIASSGPLEGFLDAPSLVITLFGSLAAVIISFPLDIIKKVPIVFKDLFSSGNDNRVELIHIFNELSRKSRLNGILSIEDDIQSLDNEMLVQGLQMVIDGKDGDAVKGLLHLEFDLTEERYEVAPSLLNKWGEYAPAFGMIGTLIGLIAMLGDLDDPSTIGGGMAVALITTLYGTMLANLIFIPLAANMELLAEDKMVSNEIVIEGIIAMQEGSNPRDLEEKLKSFLTTAELKEYEEGDSTEVFESLTRQEV